MGNFILASLICLAIGGILAWFINSRGWLESWGNTAKWALLITVAIVTSMITYSLFRSIFCD